VGESQLVLGWRRALAWTPLETPEPPGQFDGVWRVEFSNNEFCAEKGRTVLWIIRQGVLKAGETGGTVSSTGELRVTWPAWFDPTLRNRRGGKLEGARGGGRGGGQLLCGGVRTLGRGAGP